jgi:homoserine kinase
MTLPVRVRAPATTANLGPGFDCAGAALDLWNALEVSEEADGGVAVEVEGEGAGEITAGPGHLGVRAFALLAPPEGKRFRFTNRIPLARGLGSSAATIAVGLVAAALSEGRRLDAETLLGRALELESHADNLAAALLGGVCLTWEEDGAQRLARVASGLPFLPVALVPDTRVSTEAARAALPSTLAHGDAAYTAGRAALLGAALASGSPELFAAALDDRLHEPFRAANAPLLAAVRAELPPGAVGATLSGSGPTVIVWTRPEAADAAVSSLEERFSEARVLRLSVTAAGAGP